MVLGEAFGTSVTADGAMRKYDIFKSLLLSATSMLHPWHEISHLVLDSYYIKNNNPVVINGFF